MTFQEIQKQLKARDFQPVYFLHGTEPYFIDTIADWVEANVLTDAEKSFNQTILYGKDTEHKQVVDTARRYPMMAQHQVVVLKEAQTMRSLQDLLSYIEKPSPTTILVICHKYKKLNMNTKLGRALKKHKHAVVLESKPLYDNHIPGWIETYLRGKSLKISPRASALVAEYLGTNLSKISNELDKLAINIPANSEVTDKHIEEQIGISREYNIFELQKAISSGNKQKTQRIVNYFLSNPKKNPLVMCVGTLYNFFSKLYMYHFVKNLSEKQLLEALGLRSNWFLKEYQAAARNYNLARTEKVISILKEYDLRSKGVHLLTNNADKEASEQTPQGELLREMVWKLIN